MARLLALNDGGTPEVLRGMDLDGLEKSPKATEELRKKGLAPG